MLLNILVAVNAFKIFLVFHTKSIHAKFSQTLLQRHTYATFGIRCTMNNKEKTKKKKKKTTRERNRKDEK